MVALLWVIRRINLTGPRRRASSLASSMLHVGHTFHGAECGIAAGLGEDWNCVVSVCKCAWLVAWLSSAAVTTRWSCGPSVAVLLCLHFLQNAACSDLRCPQTRPVTCVPVVVNSTVWTVTAVASSVARGVIAILVTTKMEKAFSVT